MTRGCRSTNPGVPVASVPVEGGSPRVELDIKQLVQQWAGQLVGEQVFHARVSSDQELICEYVVCAAFLPSVGATRRLGPRGSLRDQTQIVYCAAEDFQSRGEPNSCYVYGIVKANNNHVEFFPRLEFGHSVELMGNPVRGTKDALQMTSGFRLITAIQNHFVDGRSAARPDPGAPARFSWVPARTLTSTTSATFFRNHPPLFRRLNTDHPLYDLHAREAQEEEQRRARGLSQIAHNGWRYTGLDDFAGHGAHQEGVVQVAAMIHNRAVTTVHGCQARRFEASWGL